MLRLKMVMMILILCIVLPGCNKPVAKTIHSTSKKPNTLSHSLIAGSAHVNKLPKINKIDDTLGKEINVPNKVPGMLVHTSFIGTPDHPTIDGGIINSTDGIAISRDLPSERSVNQPITASVKPDPKQDNPLPPFQDDWATNKKIKEFLVAANNQGKLNYILKKTDQMNLPASIAVIPMIESNYRDNVISNKGAGGAWQLMPATARKYGIKDGDRFEFNISTDTALKLLSDLHQQFGNWELTFAAYNAGSNRVLNALHKNPQASSIDDLALPIETKDYVKHMMDINKKMMELA